MTIYNINFSFFIILTYIIIVCITLIIPLLSAPMSSLVKKDSVMTNEHFQPDFFRIPTHLILLLNMLIAEVFSHTVLQS